MTQEEIQRIADVNQIEAEFAEAERALLRLDDTGEDSDATDIYEVLVWMRDELLKLKGNSKKEWKGIDTKPKPGSDYLVSNGEEVSVAFYNTYGDWEAPINTYATYEGSGTVGLHWQPLYWKDLPEPPTI